MKIVNPLYDHAFKYLMQNDRIAKKVLSTLLECEIIDLQLEQQEISVQDELRVLKLYRLDFSAVILNENGQHQRVLIELQKSKLPTNTLRFRTYLGNSYLKKEVVLDNYGEETTTAYPIISIYILGYNVSDIPYLAVSIDNKITNTVTKEEVELSSELIDLLTHKTRIIQIRRLRPERKSRLEHFLTLFDQAYATSERYILDVTDIPEEFKDIAMYLSVPVQDDAFRNQLIGEEEIDLIFKEQERDLARTKEELEKSQQREAKARQKAAAAREREAKARERVEEERKEKEAAKLQLKKLQLNIARQLLAEGKNNAEISKLTGLSEEEIDEVK